MADKVDPNASDKNSEETENKGTSQEEINKTEVPRWKDAGFESEEAMVLAARRATELESQLKRERADRNNPVFARQAQELGDLRKKLEKYEKLPEKQSEQSMSENQESDEELLESISDDEETKLLGVLNDPKNVELKKAVAKGGDKAKAEFIRNYRTHAPVEDTVLTLKKRKNDTVPLSSIAKAVKDLFKQHNESEKNNLAAVPEGGAIPDRLAKTKKQVMVGGVDVGFFAKQQ
jgi:hypothetical protein